MNPLTKEKIFKEFESLSGIELRKDPAAHGLSDMNEKLSEIVTKHSKACILTNKIIRIHGEKRNLLDES